MEDQENYNVKTEGDGVKTKQTRKCCKCRKTFPLTPEYFRRSKSGADGFEGYCRRCKSALVKAHYINWKHGDITRKGSLGVKCPLWMDSCGQCSVASLCWRLEDCSELPEYNPEFHRNDPGLEEEPAQAPTRRRKPRFLGHFSEDGGDDG